MLYTTDCLVMLLGEDITTFDCVSQREAGIAKHRLTKGVTIILLIIIKGPDDV